MGKDAYMKAAARMLDIFLAFFIFPAVAILAVVVAIVCAPFVMFATLVMIAWRFVKMVAGHMKIVVGRW